MSVKLISVTLNTSNLPQQIEFYKALGFNVETIKVAKGSEFFRAKPVGPSSDSKTQFEINLFGLKDKKNSATPIFQLSFMMDEIDLVYQKLAVIEGVVSLLDPTDMPDGRKAIVKDPDGNSIEIVKTLN